MVTYGIDGHVNPFYLDVSVRKFKAITLFRFCMEVASRDDFISIQLFIFIFENILPIDNRH